MLPQFYVDVWADPSKYGIKCYDLTLLIERFNRSLNVENIPVRDLWSRHVHNVFHAFPHVCDQNHCVLVDGFKCIPEDFKRPYYKNTIRGCNPISERMKGRAMYYNKDIPRCKNISFHKRDNRRYSSDMRKL